MIREFLFILFHHFLCGLAIICYGGSQYVTDDWNYLNNLCLLTLYVQPESSRSWTKCALSNGWRTFVIYSKFSPSILVFCKLCIRVLRYWSCCSKLCHWLWCKSTIARYLGKRLCCMSGAGFWQKWKVLLESRIGTGSRSLSDL